jgi:hypothetical protein
MFEDLDDPSGLVKFAANKRLKLTVTGYASARPGGRLVKQTATGVPHPQSDGLKSYEIGGYYFPSPDVVVAALVARRYLMSSTDPNITDEEFLRKVAAKEKMDQRVDPHEWRLDI